MTTNNKEIVLITGANTGIGFQVAKVLLRDHGERFHVLIGSRTLSKGETAVKDLHDQGLTGCEVIQLDVTSSDSIAKAVKTVEDKFGRLDVLHSNAAISPDKYRAKSGASISEAIMETMSTNVAGAAQTVEMFIPLLSKAENPRLVFVSSRLGFSRYIHSVVPNTDWPSYSASKAAFNMIALWFWHRFPHWKVNVTCPGLRSTALNNFGQGLPDNIPIGKLENGALNAVRLTLLGKDGESGKFTHYTDENGEFEEDPW